MLQIPHAFKLLILTEGDRYTISDLQCNNNYCFCQSNIVSQVCKDGKVVSIIIEQMLQSSFMCLLSGRPLIMGDRGKIGTKYFFLGKALFLEDGL